MPTMVAVDSLFKLISDYEYESKIINALEIKLLYGTAFLVGT